MTTVSRWMIGYSALAAAPFLAGLLSKALSIAPPPLSSLDPGGSPTVRAILESTGWLVLWLYAFVASWNMPDKRPGSRFFRTILFPLTSVFALIMIDHALRTDGPAIIDRIGPQRYAAGYAAGLVLSAAWLTAAWWLKRESLRRVFARTQDFAHIRPSAPIPDESGRSDASGAHHSKGERLSSAAALFTHNGGPPDTLGRYKILKELGRGAMGIVYLGKDPTIQRLVAIKTMSLDAIDDAETLRDQKTRFLREAESTGRLSHSNIVTIYDAGEEQGLVYLAMELLEGTTLKYWARKPNLMPLAQLIPIFAAVADALDYAHQQGVIHRDIKPANIMVTQQQGVKVMDFGVAKMVSSSKTHTRIVLGTPTYMSPEQLSGKKVDGRSDIFSLGVVLYELLAGRPPFTADNVPALLYTIAHTPHPPLTTLRSDLPAALIDVVNRTLQKDHAHRYRRASEFAQALRSCLQEQAA